MYGAILGDMIGAPYEFDMGNKSKEFPLFCKQSQFTDDSVMTIAVAEALMDSMGESEEQVKEKLIISMQKWGRKYPYAGYGGMFYHWLKKKNFIVLNSGQAGRRLLCIMVYGRNRLKGVRCSVTTGVSFII